MGRTSLYGPPNPGAKRRNQPERAFQHAVEQLADLNHVGHWHIPDARTAPPGWPDLVLYAQGGIIYRELKVETGRLSPAQIKMRVDLRAAGANVAVWRPSDMASGLILQELNALRRPRLMAQPEDVAWLMRELRGYASSRVTSEATWSRWEALLSGNLETLALREE